MNVSDYLYTAISASVEAGKDILAIYTDSSTDFGIEYKEDHSPLTKADKASHQRIISFLGTTGIPVLSEEGQHDSYAVRSSWNLLWVVDPLDGTKEFIKRNGDFTVNIALVRSGVPVLGVVYVPVSGVLYFGEEGLGAYRMTCPSSVTSSSLQACLDEAERLPLASSSHASFRIVASSSHMNGETAAYIEELKSVHSSTELVSRGSSIKICLVAEGTADIYPRFSPTMEWDTAAGDAIARCSGRVVVRKEDGLPLVYNKSDLHNPYFVVK